MVTPNAASRENYVGRSTGDGQSLKREENGREKPLDNVPPPPSFLISISMSGIELRSCEGLALGSVRVACMAPEKLLFRAQDIDVRLDKEFPVGNACSS